MKEFSEILRELRIKESLSQEALVNIVHVSRSAIAKYENGLGLPSEEVIESLCKYFKIDKDYLFPTEDVEKLITEKNKIINSQKRRHCLITLFLSLIIIILIVLLVIINIDDNKEIVLDDLETNISLNGNKNYQIQDLLLEYEGGYIHQNIEIKTYTFTDSTNLYLIKVTNNYINGSCAYFNGDLNFKNNEYTEKAYMELDFNVSQNYVPITTWHQKKSYSFTISNSRLNYDGEIFLEEETNLFDGAKIRKVDDEFIFYYESNITDWLLDYEYDSQLRTCKIIKRSQWNISWDYEMVSDRGKLETFKIMSFYLIESKNNELITFDIITKMVNTTMSVQRKNTINFNT